MVEPIVRRAFASLGGTTQRGAAPGSFDRDLPSREHAVAQNADALVVQRIPLPVGIVLSQQLQPVFRRIVFQHLLWGCRSKSILRRSRQLGRRPNGA